MDTIPFVQQFEEVLKAEFDKSCYHTFEFEAKRSELSLDERTALFPQTEDDHFWLHKKVWRLKEIATSPRRVSSFRPSLQDLYVFCSITGAAPNQVLNCPDNRKGTPPITFLTLEEIRELLLVLANAPQRIEEKLLLPVFCAPNELAFVALVINLIGGKGASDDPKLRTANDYSVRFLYSGMDCFTSLIETGLLSDFKDKKNKDKSDDGDYSTEHWRMLSRQYFEICSRLSCQGQRRNAVNAVYRIAETWAKELEAHSSVLTQWYPIYKTEEKTETTTPRLSEKLNKLETAKERAKARLMER